MPRWPWPSSGVQGGECGANQAQSEDSSPASPAEISQTSNQPLSLRHHRALPLCLYVSPHGPLVIGFGAPNPVWLRVNNSYLQITYFQTKSPIGNFQKFQRDMILGSCSSTRYRRCPGVVVYFMSFMCQLHWATRYLDICSNMILGVPARVFLCEINI